MDNICSIKLNNEDKEKVSFVTKCSIIWGLLSYLYFMTNNLQNYDTLDYTINGVGPSVGEGRYAIGIIDRILNAFANRWFHTQFLNGILCIFFITLANIVLVYLFEMNEKCTIAVFSRMCMVFPTIAVCMSHFYFAPNFGLAVFLISLSALLVVKRKIIGAIIAVFLISSS